MDISYLNQILSAVKGARVCVIGDVCLDLYWRADMKRSRLSRETPHFPLPVTEERGSLGGGGNVMANVAALGAAVLPVSVIGRDWRGWLLQDLFRAAGLDEGGLIVDDARVTPCYAKPLRAGISDVVYEDPRLDFENTAPLSAETEQAALSALYAAAETADVIAVSDQLECGVITPAVREALCALGKTRPVLVDSRDRIALYTNVIVKPNEVEALAAAAALAPGIPLAPAEAARLLSAHTGAPAIVTLGEGGSLWCENGTVTAVPAVKTEPPVDTVGAGDTFLSACAAALAVRVPGPDALRFASLASGVTVKKLSITGTANGEEIRQLAESVEF